MYILGAWPRKIIEKNGENFKAQLYPKVIQANWKYKVVSGTELVNQSLSPRSGSRKEAPRNFNS